MKMLAILPPDRWIEINLLDTLRRHYCDELHVFHYPGGMGQLGSSEWRNTRDGLNQDLLVLARGLRAAGRLDLIFCIIYDDFLRVETAKQLRDLGVPMVNYHVDMAFQWYRAIRTAPYFDVMAVAQMTNAEHLKAYCQDIHWMPMAANPDFYYSRTKAVSDYQYPVSFVGSFNPYRRALLASCAERGEKPVVYGRGWSAECDTGYRFDWDTYKIFHDLRYYAIPRWNADGMLSLIGPLKRKLSRRHVFQKLEGPDFRGPCQDDEMPEVFRESQVNLGFSDTGWHEANEVMPSDNLQCRLRDFEVPMSGGFYLVQEAPDHGEYYKIGTEIETWSEPMEFTDKVSFYLKNHVAAERIRQAGTSRALASHTWQHRFDRLFPRLIAARKKVHAFRQTQIVHRVANHG
ncbi:MAG TPA: glycosyltransferase [Nitrospiraceae bacterium]|nr:glycosyltransferase [Nitrospiraceae bacterium]